MDQPKKTRGRKPLPVPENLPAKSARGKKIVNSSSDDDLTPEQITAIELKRERHRIAYHVNKNKPKPTMIRVTYGESISPFIKCPFHKGESNVSIVHHEIIPDDQPQIIIHLYCDHCERYHGMYIGNDTGRATLGVIGPNHPHYKTRENW
jgi:hypothetical protein